MKKLVLLLLIIVVTTTVKAQRDDGYMPGFKKENLYVGAALNAGFFQGFILGVNPEAGYSVTRFLDLGIAANFNYVSQNFAPGLSTRYRAFGGGPYMRAWIANRFFVTAQYEYNFTRETVVSSGVKTFDNFKVPSLLVGGGYGTRFIGQSQFFTSIMIDVLRKEHSPYFDNFNQVNLPVLRTGFLVYLPTKQQREERRKQTDERMNRRRR